MHRVSLISSVALLLNVVHLVILCTMGLADGAITDEEYLVRIREGDEDAFHQLFVRYAGPLFVFARHIVKAPDVADDIVADVFAALWATRQTMIQPISVRAYLFGAIRNRAYNMIRQSRRAERWGDEFRANGKVPGLGVVDDDALTLIDQEEMREMIRAAIDTLGPRNRTVLWLRWIEQLGFDEIAVAMSASETAVRVQHSRAIRLLRDRLLGRMP